MAQAIYIPRVLRARIARVEAKRSTKHSRSASVRQFAVSEGFAPSIGGFLRGAECRLRTLQLTAIVARSVP
jgi:hypothetical protein